ncbi:tail fiber protein [Aquimarina intermedia]|uniref:Endosialidase-like protein n=1 Tax=Aquimarina intermedia TaxID=350814 RepID=A0A5S5CB06_9FLAO|nr:tail fiber protein [Aquimarina intermedia]TYP76329.1 hypothetical protein BD809_102547 [Aquimarina intermedia]
MKKSTLLVLLLSSMNFLAQDTVLTSGNPQNNFVYNNGKVGIGISIPTSQLHLNNAAGGSFLKFTRGTGNVNFAMENNLNKLYIYTGTGSITQGLAIDENGQIGIGNDNPTSQLHLKNAAGGSFLKFTRGTGNVNFAMENNVNKLYVYTGTGNITHGLSIDENGQIGIGNGNPTSQLHLKNAAGGSFMKFTRGTGNANFTMENNLDKLYIYTGTSNFNQGLSINENGKVGIGTSNHTADALLTVKGAIHSTEIKVLANAGVPDYVFEESYKLRTLEEVKEYITKHKHLPEIPSAKEIDKNGGFDVGEMNLMLLKKIEELTLYQIELLEHQKLQDFKLEKLEKELM